MYWICTVPGIHFLVLVGFFQLDVDIQVLLYMPIHVTSSSPEIGRLLGGFSMGHGSTNFCASPFADPMSQGAVLATRRCDLDEHLVQEFHEEKTCSSPQLHWEQPPGGG